MVLKDNFAKLAFDLGYPLSECNLCFVKEGKSKGIRACDYGKPLPGSELTPNQFKVVAWLKLNYKFDILIKYKYIGKLVYYGQLTYYDKTYEIYREQQYFFETYNSAYRKTLEHLLTLLVTT